MQVTLGGVAEEQMTVHKIEKAHSSFEQSPFWSQLADEPVTRAETAPTENPAHESTTVSSIYNFQTTVKIIVRIDSHTSGKVFGLLECIACVCKTVVFVDVI